MSLSDPSLTMYYTNIINVPINVLNIFPIETND